MFKISNKYLLAMTVILFAGIGTIANAATLTHSVIAAGGGNTTSANINLGHTIGND